LSSKHLQAVILAGGKGSRLRPYTTVLPKPLVPVGDAPILEVILKQLRTAGFQDIVISTGHLAELIEAYFGDGRKFGLSLRYVHENKPLSTAGALSLIDKLQENFLVMNGDILTTLKYRALYDFHTARKATATIGIFAQDIEINYGVVHTRRGIHLDRFEEKPHLHHFVSMGVNVLNRRAVSYIQKGIPLTMPDLLKRLQKKRERVLCFEAKGKWFDIGSVEHYQSAQEYLENNPKAFGLDD
jgi:NDP-sugar pyrophosphorylase family protein